MAAIMDEIKDWRKLGMGLVPLHVVDDHHYPTVREKKHAVGNYYLQTHPDASWEDLTFNLYVTEEYIAVEKAKQHLPKGMWRLCAHYMCGMCGMCFVVSCSK